jgi:dihydroflavonol-4-reductase
MYEVLVTGPDGLLGSNLVRELIQRNYKVKAMVLPGRDPVTLQGMPLEIVYGDITRLNDIVKLSKGCRYIINVAAITDTWPSRGPHYHKVNSKGTANVIEAALHNNVEKLIHVGSASSFGFGTKEDPGNENSPFKSLQYGLDYIESKLEGQNLIMEAVQNRGLKATIVCPTFMIGPYDTKPSSGALLIAVARNKMLALSSGGKNWVHVKDVAAGICNAIEKGRVGEAYILGGKNYSFKEIMHKIKAATGQPKIPQWIAPDALTKLVGIVGSISGRITKKAPKVSYSMARIACDHHYFSPKKAIEELDMPQTPIEVAFKEASDWFRANGYL